jgi:hypothetical protein
MKSSRAAYVGGHLDESEFLGILATMQFKTLVPLAVKSKVAPRAQCE